jgi:sigma-B regulation protein RsbU (phosphoserine phosphatase)
MEPNRVNRREILLVDDDSFVLDSFSVGLEPWAESRGKSIVTAGSAMDGLKHLETGHASVDLVVSDMRMPGMMGSDFLLRVKELYPGIVTILLSGYSDIQEIRKAIRAGIFSYLLKPCEPEHLAAEMETALDFHDLREENHAHLARLHEELSWAAELQRTLLSVDIPVTDRISCSVTYLPLAEIGCGGDYYDIVRLSEGRYLCLIGDVSGHGIKAAFITAMLKSAISGGFLSRADRASITPEGLLKWLNARVNHDLRRTPDILITFSAGLIDIEGGNFAFANAGHLPAFLIRGGQAVTVCCEGMGLGFAPGVDYGRIDLPIRAGDRIVFITDGLTESGKGDATLGAEDLKGILGGCCGSPDFNSRFIESVKEKRGGAAFKDDVTVVSVLIR